jgi:hypothetical protein
MYIKIHLEKNRETKSVPPNRCSSIYCTHFQDTSTSHTPSAYILHDLCEQGHRIILMQLTHRKWQRDREEVSYTARINEE